MGKRIIALLVLLLVASSAWGMLPGFNKVSASGDTIPNPYILYPTAIPTNNFAVNTGTALDAVATNDGDTTYLYTSAATKYLGFTHQATEIPSGATINYIKLIFTVRTVGTAADPQYLGPRVYIGSWQWTWNNFTPAPSTEYSEISYTSTVNPTTTVAWTLSEVNSLTWGLSTYQADVEHRITAARLEVGWSL